MRKIKSFLCFILLVLVMVTPININASSKITVKVAYYTVKNYQNGTASTSKSGWGYDYYQEIAKYANFEYEYVECSTFKEALEKVKNGECDIMGNLSYTEERSQYIEYSKNPQGTEQYYVYAKMSNDQINQEPSCLNNVKCGINQGSIQEQIFNEYCAKYGVSGISYVYYQTGNDKLDYLTNNITDISVSPKIPNDDIKQAKLKELQEIGESYYYFGISKKSLYVDEIKNGVDYAQDKILSINPNFNDALKSQYMTEKDIINTELTQEEEAYILGKSLVRVGYLNNELPLSSYEGKDEGTIIDSIERIRKAYNFEVTYTPYNSEIDLINALTEGRCDVIAPITLSSFEAEKYNISKSSGLFEESTRLYYSGNYDNISYNHGAIEKGNVTLTKYYTSINPNVTLHEYDSQIDCIKAVLSGECDFTISYDTSYGYYTGLYQDEIGAIKSVLLNDKADICFGVNKADHLLLAIFNRGIGLCDTQFITESLINNSQYDKVYTFKDFLEHNAQAAILILISIFGVILGIIIYFHVKQRKYVTILRKDELTGNPTGNYFYIEMRKMLNKHSQEDFDFLVCDVVDFKTYNDQYGTYEGDKLLLALAHFCENKLKDKCVFGRIGNDQFGLLCPHSLDIYNYVYKNFNHEFVSRFAILNNIKAFEIKFGVYECVDRTISCQQMRDRAFIALEEIKEDHSTYIRRYDDKLRERKVWIQWIAQNMHEAIENNEFEVWYQPKHKLSDNTLVGCEALVRWRNPEKGLISPGLFIPLFETNGFVCELDKYVSKKVVSNMARWKNMGLMEFPVSFNLSRVDLERNDIVSYLLPLVEKYEISPSRLHVEITETAYDNTQDVIVKKLDDLHSHGFIIEMDDFGTGYSNLNMFSEMNVDIIKLDMKFIQQNESTQNDKLMKYIIDMIKALNLKVIAEGVETETQIVKLRNLGCDMVQGYYYSKPLPLKEFEKYIKEHTIND